MGYIFRQFAKVFLGLIILFAIQRLLFIGYHFSACAQSGVWQLLKTFYKALPLDISTACYASGVSLFLILFQYWFNKKSIYRIHQVYLCIIVFISTLVAFADIIIYKEMNVKIYFKLLSHLEHPKEVLQSVPVFTWLVGVLMIVVLVFALCYFFFKFFSFENTPTQKWFLKIPITIFCFGILGTMIGAGARGGFQPIPINESEVCFSKNLILNDAAVNPNWCLMHSYIENKAIGNTNPYIFMPMPESNTLVKEMYATAYSTYDQFLTTQKPNIVFLILESWSADMVEVCGGLKGITPQFNELSKTGILFSNAYASGHLSDQGIPAVLSAFPAQPITSIIANSSKYPHLPSINQELSKAGYTTSFFFGGQLIYGNIKSYLYYNKWDVIKEQTDFMADENVTGRLGIHDQQMLQNWLGEIEKMKSPFFTCLFTLSSHSPFDMPMKEKLHFGGDDKGYVNSIFYSDSCLGDFFRKAKTQPWYKNTLFVIVADHGHQVPQNRAYNSADHHHIPILLYGYVLKENYKGKTISHIASQTDIAATILSQLKIPHDKYRWSKNLFDTTNVFAFYTFYDGFGLVSPKGNLVWDKRAGGYYTTNSFTTADSTACKQRAKAYMQSLFQEYLDF